MKLFKKKLHLEAGMRLLLGAALNRDPAAALAEVAKNGTLTHDDIAALDRELPVFELAVWHLLFLQLGGRLGAEELTRRFTISLALASRDVGQRPEQGSDELEARVSSALTYLEAAAANLSNRYADAGPGFLYCQEFTKRALPGADLRQEAAHDRHFQVFDIAQQSLRAAEAALRDLQSEYRIKIR